MSIDHLVTYSPVVPIPPPFTEGGQIAWDKLTNYLDYLYKRGVRVIMTTAGTSQFNLLTYQEAIDFNIVCGKRFPGSVIMGLQPLDTQLATAVAKQLSAEFVGAQHAIMPVYPDRYYDDDSIVEYFTNIADNSSLPLFVHGMFMRSGRGGTYNFTADLINKIARHPNIVGMKEETTDLPQAYNILKKVDPKFVKIVAGGSMRRFMYLSNCAPNMTFLAGIGNIFPELEDKFLAYMIASKQFGKFYREAQHILNHYEDPFFDVFMSMGWHRALRGALQLPGMPYHGTIDRKPFASVKPTTETGLLDIVLNDIREKMKNDKIIDNFKRESYE